MLVPGIAIAFALAVSSAHPVQSFIGPHSYRELQARCNDEFFVYHSSARISACTRLIRGQVGTPDQLAQVYKMRGIALHLSGHDTVALSDYDQALSLDPDFTDVLLRRAARRSTKGDRVGAIADLDRAVRSNQHDPDILVTRAYSYLATGDTKRAAADFDAAIGLLGADDESLAAMLLTREYFYLATGDTKRAAADFDAAIGLLGADDESLAAVYHNRGKYELDQGDYASAIDYLSLSIATGSPDPPLSLETRGQAYLAAGDPERALSDFTMLAEVPSYAGYAHVLRARVLDTLGRHSGARLAELQAWTWQTAAKIIQPRPPREGLAIEVTATLNAHVPMLTLYQDEVHLRCKLVSWAISQRKPRPWACSGKLPVPRPL
jgi:tetratricopeptide (TPR) repeat protein